MTLKISGKLSVAAIALALSSACHAHVAPTPSEHVLFFDDFTGSSLDRNHWNVRVTGPTYNDEQQAYIDDTSTVRVVPSLATEPGVNGVLLIRARGRTGFVTPEGKTFDFTSGRMDTRN